jgi:hypothetical protein
MEHAWRSVEPEAAVLWLSSIKAAWWVAGGWALDLFAGAQTRAHADLDIGMLRADAAQALAALSQWEFFEAKDGRLTRLHARAAPRAGVNSLWGRPEGTNEWVLELMLDESRDGRWIYRRYPGVQRSLAEMVRRSPAGIPYLAPEVQLLYKARSLRARDQADFDRILPLMDSEARAWLGGSLTRSDPGHPWLPQLQCR